MFRRLGYVLPVALLVLVGEGSLCAAGNHPSLAQRLTPLIAAHEGDVAIYIENLATGESFSYRETSPMPTASLIKFPIMAAAYHRAESGEVDLEEKVPLDADDRVPGSGILTPHFSPGAAFSLRDAIRLMIAYSDNTATNLVLEKVGLAETCGQMASLGLAETKINSFVFRRETSIAPARSREFGLGSTTASEMGRLFAKLYRDELGTEASRAAMKEHLLACQDREMIAAGLPRGVKFAHKTGAVSDARCDAGVIELPSGPLVICVLTAKNKDQSWSGENAAQRLCAAIGRETYAHFTTALSESPQVAIAPGEDLDAPPHTTCKAWAIADAKTGEKLWGANDDTALDFASTTKVMMAHLICELAKDSPEILNETVMFSHRADATIGSTCELRAGERLPVRDLLYGLLLPSGNDAAVAFAEHFGGRFEGNATQPPAPEPSDPLETFVAKMNAEAQELGMTRTFFRNPHGLTEQRHQSSASDLLVLARRALASPLFGEVVATRQRDCQAIGETGEARAVVWRNTNRLLEIEGYRGVKTGTTDAAGACLVSLGEREGDALLVVVLGSANSDARYIDTRNLFRWAWRQRLSTTRGASPP